MKNFTIPVFIGFLFSAIGLTMLLFTGEALTSAIWLSFGNGLVLSGLRFKHTNEIGQEVYAPIPKARIYTGAFLIVLAVLMLFVQILADTKTEVPA